MNLWKMPSKYIIAGLVTNALAYAIYCIFIVTNIFDDPIRAFQFSSLTMLPLSFYLNRIWVFESMNHKMAEFFRFTFIYGLSIFAGSIVLHLIRKAIENPYISQFLSMSLIGVSTFLMHWLWTFHQKSTQHPSTTSGH